MPSPGYCKNLTVLTGTRTLFILPTDEHRYHFRSQWPSFHDVGWVPLAHHWGFYPSWMYTQCILYYTIQHYTLFSPKNQIPLSYTLCFPTSLHYPSSAPGFLHKKNPTDGFATGWGRTNNNVTHCIMSHHISEFILSDVGCMSHKCHLPHVYTPLSCHVCHVIHLHFILELCNQAGEGSPGNQFL